METKTTAVSPLDPNMLSAPAYQQPATPQQGYEVQTLGVPLNSSMQNVQQPGYPMMQQPGYPMMQQPGYPGHAVMQQPTMVVVQTPPQAEVKPSSNLALTIVVMMCCCLPFGFIGMIFACMVDSAWADGDQEGARRNASCARRWSIAGLVCGVFVSIGLTIYLILYFVVLLPRKLIPYSPYT